MRNVDRMSIVYLEFRIIFVVSFAVVRVLLLKCLGHRTSIIYVFYRILWNTMSPSTTISEQYL